MINVCTNDVRLTMIVISPCGVARGVPHVAVVKQPNHMWEVVLEYQAGLKLGLDFRPGSYGCLYVEKVNHGLVEEWNKAQPYDRKTRAHDRIAVVNGTKGDSQKMIDVCENDLLLTMIVQRL